MGGWTGRAAWVNPSLRQRRRRVMVGGVGRVRESQVFCRLQVFFARHMSVPPQMHACCPMPSYLHVAHVTHVAHVAHAVRVAHAVACCGVRCS